MAQEWHFVVCHLFHVPTYTSFTFCASLHSLASAKRPTERRSTLRASRTPQIALHGCDSPCLPALNFQSSIVVAEGTTRHGMGYSCGRSQPVYRTTSIPLALLRLPRLLRTGQGYKGLQVPS